MDPIIIVCDNNGSPTGEYVSREVGHTGEGRHHLAITVLLINKKGEVLLQERKHKRFDRLWDLTGATDLRHFEDHDEAFEEATLRCLKKEYGIEHVENLQNFDGFNYFQKWNEYCENEFCAMLIANFNGQVDLNSEVGYSYKWVSKQDFLKDIEENPQNYTPWAIEGVKVLKQTGFFK